MNHKFCWIESPADTMCTVTLVTSDVKHYTDTELLLWSLNQAIKPDFPNCQWIPERLTPILNLVFICACLNESSKTVVLSLSDNMSAGLIVRKRSNSWEFHCVCVFGFMLKHQWTTLQVTVDLSPSESVKPEGGNQRTRCDDVRLRAEGVTPTLHLARLILCVCVHAGYKHMHTLGSEPEPAVRLQGESGSTGPTLPRGLLWIMGTGCQ